MHIVNIPVHKFLRLFDYLERLGLDVDAIAARAGMSRRVILRLEPGETIPGQQYSRLYKQAVLQMQALKQPLPWAAGIGSEAFELMCHCMISARTLGEAIGLAQRYEKMLYPMIGHRVWLETEGHTAKLGYRIRFTERGAAALVPDGWDRADYQDTVAKASGLLIWHALCGWLVGESLEIEQANIAAPFVNSAYHARLSTSFHSAVRFDADDTYFIFAAEQLQRRIVHTSDSLRELLDNAIYQLILIERRPASTSATIKSLISIDLSQGLPSFTEMAAQLHMSESSLRRRLQSESTSYQQLKDEVRCQVAIDKLLNEDARIADLSDFLGFTEPSSFVRSFKNWTGETPRSYREKIQALGESAD
ncbi:helix-turn-helix domain-containing protein [Seongchinamella sediminis]|uniref:Helix-turn-helix domain-containing protein n=1 Tax=Seongchinamella sediminis TaxID=2283635 RepID=A0A3L7E002_9GAMM|nr:AraC family transcriptional regulator [Seongchinamella sediminis]RLQ22836.1 helix-turn-helix domain-containing protein [Seongchinamella sediminis]